MKVYVSTSSKDLEVARQRMEAIEAMGHEIVLDWTQSFDASVPKSWWPKLAEADVDAVKEADCMVLIGEPTSGCFVELGAAIANRVPVVWWCSSEEYLGRHFFLHYSGLVTAHAAEHLEWILSFAEACMNHRKP